jgi:hypothetical protein
VRGGNKGVGRGGGEEEEVAASRSGAPGAGRCGVEAETGWEGVGDRSRS